MVSTIKAGDGMSSSFVSLLMRFLMRFVFLFEPLASPFVSFFLKRELREWKDKRLINDYKAKTKRIGKFHYKMDMDLDLTPEQLRHLLRRTWSTIFKEIRR